ncbi:beta-glucosidase BglX [Fulvivirga lutimaris]|uniref:beta-glucosidase BglX n=1 Tax=Fulvivirga lutimaris TaxID=1819566 RepID=UPI0012BC5F2D|nr:beta-glucosidase BglX [Fulvivirga lutimaris]MTI38800.1 beta-glucosidase BglX [Fulvivirga lutimaris]
MKGNSVIYSLFISTSLFLTNCEKADEPVKNNKIENLLSQMTLDEKIGQLNQYSIGAELTGPGAKEGQNKIRYEQLKNGGVGSVLNLLGAKNARETQQFVVDSTRLGIPLIFSYDVIHGYKTIFPIPLGESASWDLELMQNTAAVAAKEAAASGVMWTFAPMLDISRDPRWGRVMEGGGEDTYLGTEIGKARIRGFQGNDLSDITTIAACAKHFAGYGFSEGGRDYNNVYVGKHQLLNTILPAFKAAAQLEAATFMNAFNDIDGVPSSANEYLLRELLKGEWNYEGPVVSDWNSFGELITHGIANDKSEAAQLAINAGSDIDMEGSVYIESLKQLVEDNKVSEGKIDDAVRRVLKLKQDLGLLDDPFKYFDEEREKNTLLNADHLELARDAGRKSIVLLKNEGDLLPLKAKNIAVIGPLAKDKDSPIGNWRAQGETGSAVSFYEGIEAALPEANITYAEGCKLSIGPNNFFNEVEVEEEDRSGFQEAINVARNADVVLMNLGETAYFSGEARSRSEIGLPGLQLELLKEVYKVNKNIVLVLMNGRPLTIPWEAENIPAIVEAWHLGSMAGHSIADVLTGKYNPSGKLPMTFPRSVGQIPTYYNHKMTGRPSTDPGMVFYSHNMDIENSPQYPFGFGLSYSTFEYSPIALSKEVINKGEKLTVSVTVKNTSDVDGEEVVQLYIRDVVGSITRPVKELKGFKKLMIKAGESAQVDFEIGEEDLAFYRKDFTFGTEPGDFEVFVGTSSSDVQTATFKLN